jgi:ribosome-binding factor A
MKHKEPVSRGPSQRQLRVGELVRHAMADVLQRGDIIDPAIEHAIITIPEVRLSPDLKIATAYIALHDETKQDAVIKALSKHSGLFRNEIARKVNLKFVPSVRFRPDETLEAAAKIDALLRRPEVQRDLAARHDDIGEDDAE